MARAARTRPRADRPRGLDKHLLYTAAVQSVDVDLDFFRRVYRKRHGAAFRSLREDFCGTAALACEWVRRSREHTAIGVDLHRETLDWGIARYVPRLGSAAERLALVCEDVRHVTAPAVDVLVAQNFSYSVFKERAVLLGYFRTVRRSLRPGGMFFLDTLGGAETMDEMTERRRIPASRAFDGTRIPPFTYVWEQARFNPVDHDFVCHIHFRLQGGRTLRRAFTYDWRLWTLPELRDLLLEAGFAQADVYAEGWDAKSDDTDGIYRLRRRFDNESAWVAYVVGST